MRSSLVVRAWNKELERLTANAPVATVLGSIPASVGTVESEGRQMKQFWILYDKKEKIPQKNIKKKSRNRNSYAFFGTIYRSMVVFSEKQPETLLLFLYFTQHLRMYRKYVLICFNMPSKKHSSGDQVPFKLQKNEKSSFFCRCLLILAIHDTYNLSLASS